MNKKCAIDFMNKIYPGQDIREDMVGTFEELIMELSDKEIAIIKMRYGLDDGYSRTAKEVANSFEVPEETIRKTERFAIYKLRHPLRTKRIFIKK